MKTVNEMTEKERMELITALLDLVATGVPPSSEVVIILFTETETGTSTLASGTVDRTILPTLLVEYAQEINRRNLERN